MKRVLSLLLMTSAVSSFAAGQTYVNINGGLNTGWSQLGMAVNAGYQFTPYLGVEGGLTYSPGNTYNYSFGTVSGNYYMFDAAVRGTLPLTSNFALYGRLGLAVNNYSNSWTCSGIYCNGHSDSSSASNVGLLFGVGAEFKISSQWSLHLEDYTTTGNSNIVGDGGSPNFIMFGGEYRF